MSQYQFSAPPLSKTNKIILIAAGVSFLLFSVLKALGAFNLVAILGLSASGLMSGMVFQFLSYPFIEVSLMSFLFNSLVVWFMMKWLNYLVALVQISTSLQSSLL